MAYLASFGAELPERVEERLRILLKNSADPDGALHYLCRLHEEQPAAFHRITRSHASLQFLLTVFSHSEFLAEQLLKTPEWIEPLPMAGDLHRVLSAEECTERLEQRLRGTGVLIPRAEDLAQFRREQILRVLLRDLLGYAALADVTEELSNLADSILECAYRRIRASLELRHGAPQLTSGGGRCGYSVLSLGKLGGRELNYSSDVDLMFVYGGNGETAGPDTISNKEFFKKLSTHLTDLLSKHTSQGMCYRVDLRLRPEGTLGEVCISREGAESYYLKRARDWELQMLIKARVAAGEREPGWLLLHFVDPLIYSTTLDFSKIEAMSESRERIHEKLARKRNRKSEFDVKLEPGGIRDIEFLVQCLQRLHGGREAWVRHGGTLLALFRLRDKNLLSQIEYSRLAAAYQFLRTLEHRLQVAQDRQTHTLPSSSDDLDLLARRMPPAQLGGPASRDTLLGQMQRHLDSVREIYDRVIHANLPAHYMQEPLIEPRQIAPGEAENGDGILAQSSLAAVEPATSNLVRGTLMQRAPGLAATLSRMPIQRGRRQLEYFIESILPHPEWLKWLDEDPALAGYVIDLFEHSPYFAEQLNRKPELIEELRQMRLKPAAHTRYGEMPPLLADPAELRRFYSREILRIECESICLRRPIFPTLKHTSDLADCVIATAYSMAIEQVVHSQGPSTRRYQPKDQLLVVALGRLGMQEFDLGSDADLIFVLTDADLDEHLFWTRVAERMVDTITSYTGEGVMFAVDTRLRPNGREGPLVQSESAFKEYFSKTAEAWEGIAYMKSRAVAGNVERGTEFLSELQDVDWRRYGQGGRSKEKLRQLRQRLEAELGSSNPLKAGRGGYFDIDFALMFLRLRSAGIFFKVLNTPLRIEVIEKMGHLDRADAAFLLDAATFYRAVDHGMRLTSGHAEGRLPSSEMQLEMLTELIGRWTPDHLHDQPLPLELAQIQERTREFFDRLFG